MTLPWSERPAEVANLLNPAFCSILLRESILGYAQESGEHMPYALSFLVLPLVLHRQTRETLPGSVATKFHSWVHHNEAMRVGFQTRARHLVPFFKEAVFYGTQGGLLEFSSDGHFEAPRVRMSSLPWPERSEPQVCRQKARFVGRWLTRAGGVSTVFSILGIRA